MENINKGQKKLEEIIHNMKDGEQILFKDCKVNAVHANYSKVPNATLEINYSGDVFLKKTLQYFIESIDGKLKIGSNSDKVVVEEGHDNLKLKPVKGEFVVNPINIKLSYSEICY